MKIDFGKFFKNIFIEYRKIKKPEIKIILDADHGGKDPGCKGFSGTLEKNICLEITNRLAFFLSRHSIGYMLTRWGDRFISLDERCKRANQTNAKIFVSIHCNAVVDKSIKGFEVWYYGKSKKGKDLAHGCQACLHQLKFTKNRYTKSGTFRVLKKTKMSAILVELGFLTNEEDEKYLNDENNQSMVAEKLFEFIRAEVET